MRPAGFEPATLSLAPTRSIQTELRAHGPQYIVQVQKRTDTWPSFAMGACSPLRLAGRVNNSCAVRWVPFPPDPPRWNWTNYRGGAGCRWLSVHRSKADPARKAGDSEGVASGLGSGIREAA